MEPRKAIAFRDVAGRERKDVPYREKPGLVAEIGSHSPRLARTVAARIGFAGVAARFVA